MKYTLEDIRKKIYEIHGNAYKVADDAVFNGVREKIKMVCPMHGVNYSKVGNIIYRKSGCPICGREKANNSISMSFEEFKNKAIEKHGDAKFDYSIAENTWSKATDYITIKCNTCGEYFKQTGVQHIHGNGCPHCHPFPKTMDTEIFKQRLKEKQPNLIVLSEYKGADKEITVKCITHNYEYRTTPHRLLSGIGCQKCYNEKRGSSTRLTSTIFIERGKEVHDNKYDYSLIKEGDYKNNHTKLPIICPIHGVFYSDYDHHINRKQGCPKCVNKHITTEEIIERFKDIHGDDYDYSNVNYTNNRTKVTIKCNRCGRTFEQTPEKHSYGCGCPYCNTSKMENYLLKYFDNNGIKYIYQTKAKTFKWLGKLSLDFYLPEYGLAIECQGEQHFKRISMFEKKQTLNKRIQNDIEKWNLCEKNGIKMLYFTTKQLIDISKSTIFEGLYSKENIFLIDNAPEIIQKQRQ